MNEQLIKKETEQDITVNIIPLPLSKYNKILAYAPVYDASGDRIYKLEVKPSVNQTTYYIGDSFVHVINSSGNVHYGCDSTNWRAFY